MHLKAVLIFVFWQIEENSLKNYLTLYVYPQLRSLFSSVVIFTSNDSVLLFDCVNDSIFLFFFWFHFLEK